MKPEQKPATGTSLIQTAMLAVYMMFALLVTSATLYFISLSYHLGPFRDMWIAMDFIRSSFESSPTLSEFFSLHGGAHRLAVPRLFFLVEYGIFSGSNIFLIAISIIVQLSVAWLIWIALKLDPYISQRWRCFLTAMTLVLMFNATQLENFIYTFDMQWFVTSAAAVWALYFWNQVFKKLSEDAFLSASDFLFAAFFTFVSMFSSFSGLCLLLALLLLLPAYRLSFRHVFIVTLFVVLVVGFYMSGPFGVGGVWASEDMPVSASLYFRLLLNIVLLWLKWIALYFGSPLGREYFWPAALVAYSSLIFVFWNWLSLIRKGARDFTAFQILGLSLALFAAIVGISTGLGRMYFVNTADEDRYQSIVLLYWLGVFAFSLSHALQTEVRQKVLYYKYVCVAVIVVWTGVVIPLAAIKDAHAQVDFFDRVNSANLAIATRQWEYDQIKDTLILGDKWKKINRPEQHAAFLREKKWGVFSGDQFALLGTMLDQHLISADRCEGGVNAIDAVREPYRGYRITGHGQDAMNESLLKNYVAIDESGQVMGIGRLMRQKDSLLPITRQPVDQARWLLYTVDIGDPKTVQILGSLDDGGYCVMASVTLNR